MKRHNRRQRRGASALEMALTFPIILSIVSVIADLGWYLALQTHILQAVGEGARMGVTVDLDDSPTPTEYALEHTQNVLTSLGIPCEDDDHCEIEATLVSLGSLDVLRVQAAVNYVPVIGLVPCPEVIRAETTMAIEDQ